MSDRYVLEPVSAIAPSAFGNGGAPGCAIRIEVPVRTTVVVALAGVASAGAVEAGLQQIAIARGVHLRPWGPAKWLMVGPVPAETLVEDIASFDDRVSALDQSSGRVVMRVRGAPSAEALEKGTATDLHPQAFAAGASAATLFGHINIQLSRLGTDEFEIVVMRSFAESLLDELTAACREFGYEVAAG
jgi:sarcosine oxidase subunit gamma